MKLRSSEESGAITITVTSQNFEYLTKVPSPLKNIQHGLRRQTELMEKYFLHQDKKGEFYFHISKQ